MPKRCHNCRLTKVERLTSQLVIDKLFAGGSASIAAFPLRLVYMKMGKDEGANSQTVCEAAENPMCPPVSVLVSVPKKRFRHAVDRNRMKRMVREAYRLNKHILWEPLWNKEYRLAIAFVCITDTLPSFYSVQKSIRKALIRVSERMEKGEK